MISLACAAARLTGFFGAVLFSSAALLLGGCVSERYLAPRHPTSPDLLNVPLGETPVSVTLVSLITYNGPGSWKRDAFWDEYVLTFHNPSPDTPLLITAIDLEDYAGAGRHPGTNPWQLEHDSKTQEQRYRDAGAAFVRYTTPAVAILGVGSLAVLGTGVISSASLTAATLTVAAIPAYYVGVIVLNVNNRGKMESEFQRRRLALPLALPPGATRTGSLFFPVTLGPRLLRLYTAAGPVDLPLRSLHALHLDPAKVPPPPPPPKTDPALDP